MSTVATLPSVSSEGGLPRYLTEIKKFPLLEASEEAACAKRWRDHGDREAAYRLVTSHLRLAAKIAMKYRRYGLPIADLISEANLGLMLAVKRFEPDKGFRLATYAMWWIKASVQEYILRSWSLVKMGTTAAQKKLFFNLRRLKTRIATAEESDLRPEQVNYISEHLKVSPLDVIEMNRRLRGDASLNVAISDADTTEEWQDRLVDPSPNPESILSETDDYQRRQTAPLDHVFGDVRLRDLKPELERFAVNTWRPSGPGDFHPESLTDSGLDTLASSGWCHRLKAAAFR
jgi:RNA polymerase sigma-32 factor